MPPRRFLLAALPAVVVVAACSAAGVEPGPTPTLPSVATPPADGVSLRGLGFRNGPVDNVSLPADAAVVRRVDQPNVTTAFGPAADGERVREHLLRTLPAAGWQLDRDTADALLFHVTGYDGAFTRNDELWGLTLRRR